jgi:hypothetical protein
METELFELLEQTSYRTRFKTIEQLKEVISVNEDNIATILPEINLLQFKNENGTLYPQHITTDAKTSLPIEFPSLEEFVDEDVLYFKERLNHTRNCFLLSRYNHFIWLKTKDSKYAKQAVSSYHQLVLEELRQKTDSAYHSIAGNIKCLLKISAIVKYNVNEFKTFARDIISNSEYPVYFKKEILEGTLLLNSFSKNDYKDYVPLCLEWSDNEEHFIKEDILQLGVIIAKKTGQDYTVFYEKMAEIYVELAQSKHDSNGILGIEGYRRALGYYKLSKNKEKESWALKKYQEAKDKVQLAEVPIQFNDKIVDLLNVHLKSRTKEILSFEANDIYGLFSNEGHLFIDSKTLEKDSQKALRDSLENIFTLELFDINYNVNSATEKDKFKRARFNTYSLSVQILVIPLITKVVAEGIMKGKINLENLTKYLRDETWYGMSISRYQNDKYSWLELILPALTDFMFQFTRTVYTGNKQINFLLATDSLALKFEGALRDFIQLTGHSTSKEKKGEMQEKLLEELLDMEIVKEYFSVDDLLLFRFIYTKDGWNIRNNVAHSFYKTYDYGLQNMILLFLGILRLGKYKLKQQ